MTLTCVGSNPAIPAKYDPLAQSVEQLPFKQWVWSSNLQRVTKKEISPRGYLFFDTRGDSKNSMEQSGGLFLGIGLTMPTPYPVPLHRAANLQRVTAHLYLQGNCPLERSLASARRCQLLTRCLSTGAANLSGSLLKNPRCLCARDFPFLSIVQFFWASHILRVIPGRCAHQPGIRSF